MSNERMSRMISFLYKFFFIGLLLQFFLHTFVMFRLWWIHVSWLEIIWLWKELFVVLWALFVVVFAVRQRMISLLREQLTIRRLQIVFVIAVCLTFALSLFYHQQSLGEYLLAFKYDLFGFVIFFVSYHLARFLPRWSQQKMITRYSVIMHTLLVAGLIWWLVILSKPGTLGRLWYTTGSFEGEIGLAPPAAYRTQLNHWLTRNQFVFERPTSRWFYLVMFWPLYFFQFLRRKPLARTGHMWVFYAVNVLLTFSRAARGAWIIETLFLLAIMYRRRLARFALYIALPLLLVVSTGLYLAKDSVLDRQYSNTGHVKETLLWAWKVGQKPLFGRGAWFAGPWAHHGDNATNYNPENQFLQIMIEFGLVWFIPWFALYMYFIVLGRQPLLKLRHSSEKEEKNYAKSSDMVILAWAIGMIWLSISGMVLHSFSDRMIVYPTMAFLWLAVYWYYREHPTSSPHST